MAASWAVPLVLKRKAARRTPEMYEISAGLGQIAADLSTGRGENGMNVGGKTRRDFPKRRPSGPPQPKVSLVLCRQGAPIVRMMRWVTPLASRCCILSRLGWALGKTSMNHASWAGDVRQRAMSEPNPCSPRWGARSCGGPVKAGTLPKLSEGQGHHMRACAYIVPRNLRLNSCRRRFQRGY